jgi:hypothetical protein
MYRISETADLRPRYYDFPIQIEDNTKSTLESILNEFTSSSASTEEIISLDERISDFIPQLRSLHTRSLLYSYFSLAPIKFLKSWARSQSKDLDALLGKEKGGGGLNESEGLFRNGVLLGGDENWDGDWVDEALQIREMREQAARELSNARATAAAQMGGVRRI